MTEWLAGKLKAEKIVGATNDYSSIDNWHFLILFKDANGNKRAAMVPRNIANSQIPHVSSFSFIQAVSKMSDPFYFVF